WVLALIFFLSNIGVNITSLVAGLGIGGIAIALALQTILSDLFSSFAIYFDKPFVVGDFIVVGDKSGVVEHIGIKTTRLRALQGEENVITNQELPKASLNNFRTLERRRVVLTPRIPYHTPNKQLHELPSIIQQCIEGTEGTTFDRSHLASFQPSWLEFETVYY